MIEIAQHIETLLLENDCVIVPQLGGFVAHYTPARRVAGENLFLPPARIIGFNPQLKMNDGLLVQSYMSLYETDFPDATRRVEKEVRELKALLHEEGKAELPNVGELRCSIHGTYDFVPYDHRMAAPSLYGLGSFEMRELSALPQPAATRPGGPQLPTPERRRRPGRIRIRRHHLSNAAAIVAAILLFFCLSVPVENTEIPEENYARLLPEELFEKIEKRSLAITPIVISQQPDEQKKSNRTVAPVTVKEVKVKQQPQPEAKPKTTPASAPETRPATATAQPAATAQSPAAVKPAQADKASATAKTAATATPANKPAATAKRYHIIVASVGTEKDARAMASSLIGEGHAGAQALIGDGKMRVSIRSCATQEEAYQVLKEVRRNEKYQQAWVLKK